MNPADLKAARENLGELWGYGRPLKMAELGRALGYAQTQEASQRIRRYEELGVRLPPPAKVAIEMMLAGAKPPNFDFIRPSSYKKMKKNEKI